ncbi:MAG: twin-arginine translocase TatA/TatE family subunit [Crocinitomicaceae bacterium]
MSLLFLNSLGTGEVIMIFVVILILFGSKGIPDIAKNLGRGIREIKDASNEIKRDIQKSALEMRKDLKVEEFDDITKIDSSPKKDTKVEKNEGDDSSPKNEDKQST